MEGEDYRRHLETSSGGHDQIVMGVCERGLGVGC